MSFTQHDVDSMTDKLQSFTPGERDALAAYLSAAEGSDDVEGYIIINAEVPRDVSFDRVSKLLRVERAEPSRIWSWEGDKAIDHDRRG